MKVLIIKLSSLGDVVHTLPSLRALRKGLSRRLRPGEPLIIDWLVEEGSSSLLSGHMMIDELHVVKNRGWTKDLRGNVAVARRLRARGYDVVIDFQGLLKSAVWVWLTRAPRKVGFSNYREGSPFFLNEKLPPYDPDMHAVDRYLTLAAHVGGVTGSPEFPLGVTKLRRSALSRLLGEYGLEEGEGFFTVIARSRWETKLWSDEGFAEVIKTVRDRLGLRAVLVGGGGDARGLDDIVKGAGDAGAVNLAGRTGLGELAALMEMSRLVLSVDSGPMHIAAAAGAPVIALFGPTSPWRTGPYGKGHVIIRKEMECSPCHKRNCSDKRCMNDISPAEVVSVICDVVREGEKRQGSPA